MIALQSSLDGQEGSFGEFTSFFNNHEFILGSNWQIDHGFFDRMLDPKEHVTGQNYLRIPVIALQGEIGDDEATVRLGTPFVLCHEYQDSLDDNVVPRVVGSMFDQFSEPEDKDAPIKNQWLEKGETILKEIEQQFQTRNQ